VGAYEAELDEGSEDDKDGEVIVHAVCVRSCEALVIPHFGDTLVSAVDVNSLHKEDGRGKVVSKS
jgi:hypothetical protein